VASHCDDSEKPFIISKLHKIIDRFEHIISLRMVLPDTDKGKVNTSVDAQSFTDAELK
jgi:hypothetical protein